MVYGLSGGSYQGLTPEYLIGYCYKTDCKENRGYYQKSGTLSTPDVDDNRDFIYCRPLVISVI